MSTIWLFAGLVLGACFIALARTFGERRIFAVGLIVAALIYLGFAVFGHADPRWIGTEVLGVALYGTVAWLGLRHTAWWLVVGWAAHPIWDIALHLVGSSTYAPSWYAILCISFDVLVALYIASQCRRRAGA